MSTNISHGYRLKPGIEPFDFITRVREIMDPARDAADAKLLAGLYVDAIDELWFRGDAIAERAGYAAWSEWHLEQSRTSPMDRSHDPNEFGVQIGKDPLTGGFYLLAVTYNQDLREAFDAMEEIEEYGFWNSSDSYPDGVTRADWEVREALWDRIIPGLCRSNMMTFNLRHASDRGVQRRLGVDGEDTTSVFAAIPTDAERASGVAGNAYLLYLTKEKGVGVFDAVNHVGFGQSANLSLVTDVAMAHLPAITQDLVTEGSHGAVINPAYAVDMKAACEAHYELDKERLNR